MRKLGILTVRDRVAQHAMAQVFSNRYESTFLPSSYAFRPGKSAKKAVEQVCTWIQEGRSAVFRSDIADYFNSIDHALLLEALAHDCDEAFIRLLQESIALPEMRDGLPVRRTVGLCQGSPLSPILSNLFLHTFDRTMTEHSDAYLRYCDDFVCLENAIVDARVLQEIAVDALARLKLALKPKKSFIGNIADGFSFLGHFFSDQGSIAAVQAVESLEDRLLPGLQRLRDAFIQNAREDQESIALDYRETADILRGWLQYYELPPSVYVRAVFAAAALALAVVDEDQNAVQRVFRAEWLDDWADSAYWPLIAELCVLLGQPFPAIQLYETWFGWQGPDDRNATGADSLYPLWRAYCATMRHDWLTELTQTYADLGIYAFAESSYQQSVLTYDGENGSGRSEEISPKQMEDEREDVSNPSRENVHSTESVNSGPFYRGKIRERYYGLR